MTSALRREVFNLPNYLTMVRILAIPVVVWLLVQDSPLTNLIAVTIFLLAALTDMLDGYLARRMGLDSALGKLLDPLADKILVSTVMIALVPLGRMEAWIPMVVIPGSLTSIDPGRVSIRIDSSNRLGCFEGVAWPSFVSFRQP